MDNMQSAICRSFETNSNKVAIVSHNGDEITYRELCDEVRGYYGYIKKEIGERKKVLLKFKDIHYQIVAMIACIFSNNTFITISGDCSKEREDAIKKQLGDYFILMEEMVIDCCAGNQVELPSLNFETDVPLYIYFTSGTTGDPKAVMGRNESLLHFIRWEINQFSFGEEHSFAQVTNVMFDPFLRDVFVPILSGGRLVLPPGNILYLPRLFLGWIKKNNITCMHCTPSLLNMITMESSTKDRLDLEYLFLAGEAILGAKLDRWYSRLGERTKVVNLYGPTETTLAKCFYIIDPQKDCNLRIVPVGKPIEDDTVLVLDKELRECGEGISGEIYIGMKYGSWGYLNNVGKDKFQKISDKYDFDFYKTGDIGYFSEGNLFVTGRSDRQVKLSGIRVELDGVENALMKDFEIKDVAVCNVDSDLYIFIVPGESGENKKAIIEYIRSKFMLKHITLKVIFAERLELTSNGKKDYRKILEGREKG